MRLLLLIMHQQLVATHNDSGPESQGLQPSGIGVTGWSMLQWLLGLASLFAANALLEKVAHATLHISFPSSLIGGRATRG